MFSVFIAAKQLTLMCIENLGKGVTYVCYYYEEERSKKKVMRKSNATVRILAC